MGAPVGNDNRARQYRIKRTLERVLAERSASKSDALEGLVAACEALVSKAEDGDVAAFKEMADRLDGKVPQSIGGAEDLPPLLNNLTVTLVGPTT